MNLKHFWNYFIILIKILPASLNDDCWIYFIIGWGERQASWYVSLFAKLFMSEARALKKYKKSLPQQQLIQRQKRGVEECWICDDSDLKSRLHHMLAPLFLFRLSNATKPNVYSQANKCNGYGSIMLSYNFFLIPSVFLVLSRSF